jgi:hypothetical protein
MCIFLSERARVFPFKQGVRHGLYFLGEIKPIKLHDLVPCGDKIMHERVFGVIAGIDFRQSAQLRI